MRSTWAHHAFHTLVLLSMALVAATKAAGPADVLPEAVWAFNGAVQQTVFDLSGHRHHAIERLRGVYAASPGGQAKVFNGRDEFLQVRDHPDLRMTDRLTVNGWIRLDDVERSDMQCLLDKGGERYRISIRGSTVTFGLKGVGENRMDLNGGKLSARTWHRITTVFQRPKAAIYVDGRQVAQGSWDHDIGPGGDLYIGAQAGRFYFFRGQIDELRIYRDARPPLSTDIPSAESGRTVQPAPPAKMEVTQTPGGVTVDTGAMRVELTDDAGLRSLSIGQKKLVAGNAQPLLTAEVFQSKDYDGWRDHATGETICATWRPSGHDYQRRERQFTAAYTGRLDFGSGDAIDCRLTLSTKAGSPFVTATTQLEPQGRFENRFVRSVALRLPLALHDRKRIMQAGDRGVQWNTRYRYQFHVGTMEGLLPEPDHNLWRLFAVDQNAPTDYHIWRCESPVTGPLSMQRGLQAPGWMAAYDEQAGVLFAYRGLAQRAPKSLRVAADGSGETAVYLWHAGLPALDIRSPQAAAVFGAPHVADWLAFAGNPDDSHPDVALAQHWGVDALASDPPARNELPLADLNLLDAPAADADAPLVTGGVPLPRGALKDAANVRLRREASDVPLQARAIGYWPDRSIKWLLLTFPVEGGAVQGASGEGDALRFELSRRDGSKTAYRLDYGGTSRPGTPQSTLTAQPQEKDSVRINTGPLALEVGTGQRWLRSVKLQGREMLAQEGVRSFVDFLRTESAPECMTTHVQGTPDDGPFFAQSVQLEEAGPLRAVVRLEGMTTAKEPTRVIVRIEAYAGRCAVRVFHTVEFLHKDPRNTFVRRMGLELPLAAGDAQQVTIGGQEGPVRLASAERAGLKQSSHLGYQAWHQAAGERFLRVDEAKHRSRGWLDLSGPSGGATVVLRDMWQQFPNELVADVQGRRLVAQLWPESQPVMDMRRYSNYPHPAQGESAAPDSRWVVNSYHSRDPIVGLSKTHELLLYFHGPATDASRIDAVAAEFQRPALVYAGGDWYVKTGVVLPQSLPGSEQFPRAHANLDHFARFWMHHQKLWGWYGFWDYGDVQHYFKGGYGSIVPADKLVELLRTEKPGATLDVAKWRVQDYAPNHDWAFENGRWGWGNTEGLPGMYVQNQYLRTGDRDLFFFAEALARHVRDVDMRHDGAWFGLGTRHGVQHWSDGNHEERQTTHSEFRYIYALTGDGRSRDFARQLFERIYSTRPVSIHAAHSGRLQGLLTWWEMTGSEEVRALLAKYVPCFIVPEGICESPRVVFPEVKCTSQTKDINAGNMFFWTFGAGHGLLEYFELVRDPGLRRALIESADLAIRQPDPVLRRKSVTFAARYADDPARYRRYLESWAAASPLVTQVVPHNPQVYGGPHGFLHGGVSGAWFGMNDIPYLLSVLSGDPQLSERERDALSQADQSGGPPTRPLELDWQSSFDRPELKEYLRIKHMQP